MTLPETDPIWRAVAMAEAAHRGHRRKTVRSPYLLHPLGVAHLLLSYGFPEHPLCTAALLHDTLEHGLLTRKEIQREFGPAVTGLVFAVTPSLYGSWEQRKAETIERLRSAPDDVVALACADKFDNLLSVRNDLALFGERAWERLGRSRGAQEWYYRSLAAAFEERAATHPRPAILTDFADRVREVFSEQPRCSVGSAR